MEHCTIVEHRRWGHVVVKEFARKHVVPHLCCRMDVVIDGVGECVLHDTELCHLHESSPDIVIGMLISPQLKKSAGPAGMARLEEDMLAYLRARKPACFILEAAQFYASAACGTSKGRRTSKRQVHEVGSVAFMTKCAQLQYAVRLLLLDHVDWFLLPKERSYLIGFSSVHGGAEGADTLVRRVNEVLDMVRMRTRWTVLNIILDLAGEAHECAAERFKASKFLLHSRRFFHYITN